MKFTIRDLMFLTMIGLVVGCQQGPGVFTPATANPTQESSFAGKWTCVSRPSIQIEFSSNKLVISDSIQNSEAVWGCEFTSYGVILKRDDSAQATIMITKLNEQELAIEFQDGKLHFKRQQCPPNSSEPAANPPKE